LAARSGPIDRDPGSAACPFCDGLAGTNLSYNMTPYLFLAALVAGFAYMQWRESRNPGALGRGAMMLVRSGTLEDEVEPNEPVAPL